MLERRRDAVRGEAVDHRPGGRDDGVGGAAVLPVEGADRGVGRLGPGGHHVDDRREVEVDSGVVQRGAEPVGEPGQLRRRAGRPGRGPRAAARNRDPFRDWTAPPSWSTAIQSPGPGAAACQRAAVAARSAAGACDRPARKIPPTPLAARASPPAEVVEADARPRTAERPGPAGPASRARSRTAAAGPVRGPAGAALLERRCSTGGVGVAGAVAPRALRRRSSR